MIAKTGNGTGSDALSIIFVETGACPGYMLEYPIAEMYRDARAQRIYGGTNEVMKSLIARSL